MVFQIEKRHASDDGGTYSYYKEWISLYGKVNRIKLFHQHQGEKLQERMKIIEPPKHFFQNKAKS